ncbi:AraC family transcriptional regulator [Gramella lutea]|uniref:AraC family transcriptional regulator n=1 Tax=Christiangramia lutea TaxID=1607951 RepID=A0A9X1V5C3_9FLAO|nr:AraC family transcriptional regulator [Christiangramia lutea]MCH4824524.1 AraC family transcriptional regulator [Christiangramia lutea]
MEKNRIQIKNVVCQRCIMTVKGILDKLEIPYVKVDLGEAVLKRELSRSERKILEEEFSQVGFEIIQDREKRLINMIKSLIIDEVYSEDSLNTKLSTILTAKLNFDYSHITHVFTESEGQSIQKYYNALRIESAKELLGYDELGIAEIADRLGYSTPAYLSTSFKKATGYTPSEYRGLDLHDRKSLDSV